VNNALGNPEWAEVERAFGAALELPEERHAAFLATLPTTVRAEVESLLRAHFRADSFLQRDSDAPSSGDGERRVACGLLTWIAGPLGDQLCTVAVTDEGHA